MRLGELLIERKQITQEDLDRALELQKERGEKLGKVLVDLGFIAMRDVLAALSAQLGVPLVSIDGPPAVSPETESLSPRFLRQFRCLPLTLFDHSVQLAMADPMDFETISAVQTSTGLRVVTALAPEQEILEAIDKYFGESARSESETGDDGAAASEDLEHLRDMASEAPVIRLVNAMIALAVEKRASDIHIEPFEREFRVRYRVDGVLYNQDAPPRDLKAAIISRVKLMAKLNIA
ncbi:MAG TPA: ATPase, T2SS/T4P/T4SS family, partial [Bryobacteraceae bacterium]|nr:ATPase, T2SS/T4P/T4SS family [Bryobacteraceae bacterium]